MDSNENDIEMTEDEERIELVEHRLHAEGLLKQLPQLRRRLEPLLHAYQQAEQAYLSAAQQYGAHASGPKLLWMQDLWNVESAAVWRFRVGKEIERYLASQGMPDKIAAAGTFVEVRLETFRAVGNHIESYEDVHDVEDE